MYRYICVMVGGGAGSLARYVVGRVLTEKFPNVNFALGTFAVNVTGSFLIGFLMKLLVERLQLPDYWRLLAVVGFLGGYTTFSSFEYDAYLSARGGHSLAAAAYVMGSVILGYGAVLLGSWLAAKH